jgi:hypothetical protein
LEGNLSATSRVRVGRSIASMRLVLAFVVFLCGLASEAMSQDIPDYDTEAFCEQRAGGKAPNNRRYASCLTMEKLALDQIEDYWPEASETIRSECIDIPIS